MSGLTSGNKKFERPKIQNWESLLEISKNDIPPEISTEKDPSFLFEPRETSGTHKFLYHKKYIVIASDKGFDFISIFPALERIYFSQIIDALKFNQPLSQQELFPVNIHLTPKQSDLVKELLPQLNQIGIDLEPLGKHSFVIKGLPAFHTINDPQNFIEEIIDNYDNFQEKPSVKIMETVARLTARSIALRKSAKITEQEAEFIIGTLLECENYAYSPSGKPTIYTFTTEEIDKKFT